MNPDQKTLNNPESLNRSYVSPEVVHQRRRTIEALEIQPGESILDIGCGTGFLTLELAQVVGSKGRVLAIDPDSSMVDHTRDRCAGLDHVQAKVGEAYKLPGSDNFFDIVTCISVLTPTKYRTFCARS